ADEGRGHHVHHRGAHGGHLHDPPHLRYGPGLLQGRPEPLRQGVTVEVSDPIEEPRDLSDLSGEDASFADSDDVDLEGSAADDAAADEAAVDDAAADDIVVVE